ncbi:hypothetical protein [Clostridium oceanicum]|uniref:Uncharacterized protein n=1 Tax=Clostridium oceanicum TaxID=1543 RepID=A0ABP3UID8_9CLOT
MRKIKRVLFRIRNKKKYLFKNGTTLSEMLKYELKDNKKLIKEKETSLWIPSVSSFIKLLLLFLIITIICNIGASSYILSRLNFYIINKINVPIIKSNTPMFQNLIAINTGIGAVLIGVAFFVAQSLMDKEEPDKARVLLYKSKFYPLLSSEIFTFLIFLTGNLNYMIIVVTMLLGLATIYSLGNTVSILIRANNLENAKKEVFVDILKRSFIKIWNNEINKRISNNKFRQKIQQLVKIYSGVISINKFGAINKNKYVKIKSPFKGRLVDINFLELNMLIDTIINKTSTIDLISTLHEGSLDIYSNTERKINEPIIVITASIYCKITEETTLLEVRKDIIEDNVALLDEIISNIKFIFIVNNYEDSEEEARFEISKLKQRCLHLIGIEREDELKKNLNLYNQLIRELYKYMKKQYGGFFSKQQAQSERTAFFGERLKPLDWISDDIRKIFDEGLKSENKDIIRIVAYTPISLAQLSIKQGDHLIYQSFIYYPEIMYIEGYKQLEDNKELADFMIDRSWKYITELSDYYLVNLYDEKELSDKDFNDFSFYLLKVFQNLLKQSFDYRDINNFKIFLKKMLKLFDRLDTGYYIRNFQYNKVVCDFLNNSKQEVLFALGSWILYEYRKFNDKKILHFFENILINLLSDITEVTNLFIKVHTFEKEDIWQWSNWEFDEHNDDDEWYSIGILDKLEVFYLVVCLKILENKTENQIKNIKLPFSRELAFLAEGTRSLMKTIKSIESEKHKWLNVLSEEAISKCEQFKNLLMKSKQEQENLEQEKKRNTRISQKKVKEFKCNFIKNVESTYGFRSILSFYELIKFEMQTVLTGNNKKFGINTFFDKSAFFDDDIEPYFQFRGLDDAFNFGRSIIEGENKTIIKKMNELVDIIDKSEFENYLDGVEDISKLIFISVNNAAYDFFERKFDNNKYIPKWHREFGENNAKKYSKEITGIYKHKNYNIPVYNVFCDKNEFEIFIVDISKIGKMIQYSPIENEKDQSEVFNYFTIDVQEIVKGSQKEREILENPPNWLIKKGDSNKQSLYIEERVIIQIYERFDFVLEESAPGVRICIK